MNESSSFLQHNAVSPPPRPLSVLVCAGCTPLLPRLSLSLVAGRCMPANTATPNRSAEVWRRRAASARPRPTSPPSTPKSPRGPQAVKPRSRLVSLRGENAGVKAKDAQGQGRAKAQETHASTPPLPALVPLATEMETSLAFPQRPNDADKTKPATPARPSLLPKHPRQTDPYPFPTGFSHPSSLYPINVRWNLKTPISSSFPTTTLKRFETGISKP
jgi:hypothetical protein